MILRDATSLVDIHSHLVPAVDDGAKDVIAVVESVERMTRVGIRRLVTTPHIRASLTLDPERLQDRLGTVTEAWDTAGQAVRREFPEVEYHRGHEVLLDVPEPDLSDPRIRMAGTSFVLIEWPRLHIPPGTPRVIKWIREQGYRPIIAHPERYTGMIRAPEMAQRWCDTGAVLQLNYGSLVGRYGTESQTVAFRILEAGLASYLASDFHGHSGMKIYKTEAWAALDKRDAYDALQTLCRTNPSRLIQGEDPVPVGAVAAGSTVLDRISGIVRREAS